MARYLILDSKTREPYSYSNRNGLQLGGVPALFSLTSAARAIDTFMVRKKLTRRSAFRVQQARIADVKVKPKRSKKQPRSRR